LHSDTQQDVHSPRHKRLSGKKLNPMNHL
jgi:hypothetical protein